MTIYQKSIIEITGCKKEDAATIEDIMRHDILHSTLDWVSESKFNKVAKEAKEVLDYMRSPEGVAYMNSLKY